jgi:hypothetical protein
MRSGICDVTCDRCGGQIYSDDWGTTIHEPGDDQGYWSDYCALCSSKIVEELLECVHDQSKTIKAISARCCENCRWWNGYDCTWGDIPMDTDPEIFCCINWKEPEVKNA